MEERRKAKFCSAVRLVRTPFSDEEEAVRAFGKWSSGYADSDSADVEWPLWVLGAKLVRVSLRENVSRGVDDLSGCEPLTLLLNYGPQFSSASDATMVLSLFARFFRPLLDRDDLRGVLEDLDFTASDARDVHGALFGDPLPKIPSKSTDWARIAAKIIRGAGFPAFQPETVFRATIKRVCRRQKLPSPLSGSPLNGYVHPQFRCNALRRLGDLRLGLQSPKTPDHTLRTLVFNAHFFFDTALSYDILAGSTDTRLSEAKMLAFLDTATDLIGGGSSGAGPFDRAFLDLVNSDLFASCYSAVHPDSAIPEGSIDWCLQSAFGFKRDGTLASGVSTGPLIDQKMAMFFDRGLGTDEIMCTAGLLLYVVQHGSGPLQKALLPHKTDLAKVAKPCIDRRSPSRLVRTLYRTISAYLCESELTAEHIYIVATWLAGLRRRAVRKEPSGNPVSLATPQRFRSDSVTAATLGTSSRPSKYYDWTVDTGGDFVSILFDVAWGLAETAWALHMFVTTLKLIIQAIRFSLSELSPFPRLKDILTDSEYAVPFFASSVAGGVALYCGPPAAVAALGVLVGSAPVLGGLVGSGATVGIVGGALAIGGASTLAYRRRKQGNPTAETYRILEEELASIKESTSYYARPYQYGSVISFAYRTGADLSGLLNELQGNKVQFNSVLFVWNGEANSIARTLRLHARLTESSGTANAVVYGLGYTLFWMPVAVVIQMAVKMCADYSVRAAGRADNAGNTRGWQFVYRQFPKLAMTVVSVGLNYSFGRTWILFWKALITLFGMVKETLGPLADLSARFNFKEVGELLYNESWYAGASATMSMVFLGVGAFTTAPLGGTMIALGLVTTGTFGLLANAYSNAKEAKGAQGEEFKKILSDMKEDASKWQGANGWTALYLRQLHESSPMIMYHLSVIFTDFMGFLIEKKDISKNPYFPRFVHVVADMSRKWARTAITMQITGLIMHFCSGWKFLEKMNITKLVATKDTGKALEQVEKINNLIDGDISIRGENVPWMLQAIRSGGASQTFSTLFMFVYSSVSFLDDYFENAISAPYTKMDDFDDFDVQHEHRRKCAENIANEICMYPLTPNAMDDEGVIMEVYRIDGTLTKSVFVNWRRYNLCADEWRAAGYGDNPDVTTLLKNIKGWIATLWKNLCVPRYCETINQALSARANLKTEIESLLKTRLSFAMDCLFASGDDNPCVFFKRDGSEDDPERQRFLFNVHVKCGFEVHNGVNVYQMLDFLFLRFIEEWTTYANIRPGTNRINCVTLFGERENNTLLTQQLKITRRVFENFQVVPANQGGASLGNLRRPDIIGKFDALFRDDTHTAVLHFFSYEDLLSDKLRVLLPDLLTPVTELESARFVRYLHGDRWLCRPQGDYHAPINKIDVVGNDPGNDERPPNIIIVADEFVLSKRSPTFSGENIDKRFFYYAYMAMCQLRYRYWTSRRLSEPDDKNGREEVTPGFVSVESADGKYNIDEEFVRVKYHFEAKVTDEKMIVELIDLVGIGAVASFAIASGKGATLAVLATVYSAHLRGDWWWAVKFAAGGAAVGKLLSDYLKGSDDETPPTPPMGRDEATRLLKRVVDVLGDPVVIAGAAGGAVAGVVAQVGEDKQQNAEILQGLWSLIDIAMIGPSTSGPVSSSVKGAS